MTQRQKEIIGKSIALFNQNGASNVKLLDITLALDISLGNLTYYYKTKKDLIQAILNYMVADRENLNVQSEQLLSEDNWVGLTENYLRFQLKYRFFYRDILDLAVMHDQAKVLYKKEVNKVIDFIENSIYQSIEKGYMKPEPREGLYNGIAENEWSIIQAWFIKRAVFGENKVPMDVLVRAIMDLYYPYATKKGIAAFEDLYSGKSMLLS